MIYAAISPDGSSTFYLRHFHQVAPLQSILPVPTRGATLAGPTGVVTVETSLRFLGEVVSQVLPVVVKATRWRHCLGLRDDPRVTEGVDGRVALFLGDDQELLYKVLCA